VSFTLLPEQIKDLRQEFEKFDRDGSGEITLEDMKEVLLNCSQRPGSDFSVGTLTEAEAELIFDSLHLNTKETTIKWHKFITAGLSRCNYDDRNLRLAFNRLDHNEKGFINIDDLNDMLRSNDGSMDKVILEMWKDGMESVRCKCKDKIYFEDFQCFFKGHATKPDVSGSLDPLQEDAEYSESSMAECTQSNRFSPKRRASKRVSLNSTRLLASALALGIEDDLDSSHRLADDDESDELMSIGQNDVSSQFASDRSFSRMPPRRRSSGAILIKSRSIGVWD